MEKESYRLESFSDGVFAFAITLLALDLRVPVLEGAASSAELKRALLAMWPSFLIFGGSFASILVMWINHRGIFRSLRQVTPALFFANGFLLLLVCVTPFTTSLAARYLLTPAASLATAVYCSTFILVSAAYNWLWRTAASCGDRTPHHQRVTSNYRVGFPIYCAATAAAFLSPVLALGICAGLWVFWAATMREA